MIDEKNRPEDENGPDDEGFGLVAPTGNMADQPDDDRPEIHHSQSMIPEKKSKVRDPGATTWKGFEEEVEDEDPDVSFTAGKFETETEMDMTPMVDVTFLLLIFFMVTASFTLVQTMQQPPAAINEPSTNFEEQEDEEDYVQVTIDQNNSYYVTSRDADETEAPSDREMRAQMRDAMNLTSCTRLIIKAHVESTHGKAVTVWDAGIALGMQQIEMETIDEEF
ncbi:MAG: biopolymer transporter ExbD [Planctomycetota bacterium]